MAEGTRATASDDPFDRGPPVAPRPRLLPRFLVWSVLAATAIGAIAAGLVEAHLETRRADRHAAAAGRLEALTRGRAEILRTWVDGVALLAQRLTDSDLLRLFAAEMAVTEAGTPPPRWLANQRRYMVSLMADFVRQHRLLGAALVGLDGRILVTSPGAPIPDLGAAGGLAARVRAAGRTTLPLRRIGSGSPGMALDIVLPVPSPQPAFAPPGAMIATLVLTAPATDILRRALATDASTAPERLRLVQAGGVGPEAIVLAGGELEAIALDDAPFVPGEGIAPVMDGGSPRLSLGVPVPGLPWTVLGEIERAGQLAAVAGDRARALAVATLAGAALFVLLALIWWVQSRATRRDLAAVAAACDRRVGRRRVVLESLGQLLPEMIAVKTPDGRYVYVNPALAAALRRPAGDIVGRTDAELGAAALGAGDPGAGAARAVLDEPAAIDLGQGVQQLVVSKLPLRDEAGEAFGLLTLIRDRTEPVARERQRYEVRRGALDALLAAIAARDPGLGARIDQVRRYAGAVATRLGLDDDANRTLDLAAGLVQIGRLGLPAGSAEKAGADADGDEPGPGHVGAIADLLGLLGFDVSVVAVVRRALAAPPKGDAETTREPDRIADILGVVDRFCALTNRLRDPLSPGQALYRLAEGGTPADRQVLAALAATIEAETRATAGERRPEPQTDADRGEDEKAA